MNTNTFADKLNRISEMGKTENGAIKYTTTGDKVYNLFALGGAYRERDVSDRVKLFNEAYDENPELAIKCLYYLRDIRGGQGERQFFRDCITNLLSTAKLSTNQIKHLISIIPEYGRWDDVVYLYDRIGENGILIDMIAKQLYADIKAEYPSLLAKWMPSENASSSETKRTARRLAKALLMTNKEYREMLSFIRKKINLVESLMSDNRWDDIEFGKLPSKAGFKYRHAFITREETHERYAEFIKSKDTKVNSGTLYPYEITSKCDTYVDDSEKATLQKYWENLPDYCRGTDKSAICVVDVSGSMYGRPMSVSTSLGIYCAERLRGAFKDLFITFSAEPKVQKIKGKDIYEKVHNLERADWGANTDLVKVFNLLYKIATAEGTRKEDIPNTVVIISDMEIDSAAGTYDMWSYKKIDDVQINSTMESIRDRWKAAGLTMPHLVYWNVNARNDTILDRGENVTCVSGFSPVLFECVLTGKTGIDVMLDKLNSPRYAEVHL